MKKVFLLTISLLFANQMSVDGGLNVSGQVNASSFSGDGSALTNLNLVNIEDITNAIRIILNKNINSGKYILKNNYFINIFQLINYINKNTKKKIKIKWLSNIKIKDKFLKYRKLKSWKPKKSNIKNIKNLILNN